MPAGAIAPPLALYVHTPWCLAKCPYCDFNSHALRDALPERDYINTLIADFDQQRDRLGARPIRTVFIGGGTPSLFSAASFARLIDAVAAGHTLDADAEITMEANPGSLECGTLRDYRRAGINRLSIGVQSFDAAALTALGRQHSPDDARRAFGEAAAAGFDSINLDLMYGLPDQSVDEALADVRTAIELGTPHLSHYQLTLEPNTVFFASPPALPDDETVTKIEVATGRELRAAGYRRYEISALARPAHECRHNLNYWNFGDYVGIGAGAHGKITDIDGRVTRTTRPAHPRSYAGSVQRGDEVATEAVSGRQRIFEFMLNSTRLSDGFDLTALGPLDDDDEAALGTALGRAQALDLLSSTAGRYRPTERGFRFLNDLQELFLP